MKELHLALIGGPQYDGLLQALPAFEQQTGYRVVVDVTLPHVELNERMAADLGSQAGHYDLISTHTKYCPSQAEHLRPLDELVDPSALSDFVPRVLELCRIDGRLMQLPRNFDARLLFYRADLAPAPGTWDEAAEQMRQHAGRGLFGFAFPGRHSGLFGSFYELLGMAGGELFDDAMRPIFNSAAGEWALSFLHRLHSVDRLTPPDLLEHWYYDEVSEAFRAGRVLMIGDWPGFYGLYQDRQTCAVYDQYDVAVYPAGPAGIRRAYAGAHSFAIPTAARDPQGGLALAQYLTSAEVQWLEASQGGHTPVRQSVFDRLTDIQVGRDAKRMALLEETVREHAMVPPRFARYPQVEDVLWIGVQSAMRAEQAPAQALAWMEERVMEILQ